MFDEKHVREAIEAEAYLKGEAKGYAAGEAKGYAAGEAKGADDERTAVALDMLADNEPLEKIVKYSHLSKEKVLELKENQATFTAK